MDATLQFNDYNLILMKGNYCNRVDGRVSISVIDMEDTNPSPYSTVTVNIPSIELEADEAIIKNYGENKGLMEALIEEKIIEAPHRFVTFGDWSLPVARIRI